MNPNYGAGAAESRSPGAGCDEVRDDLPELALGALSGLDRVTALAHVETCTACAAELDQLALVADQLLHLAPSAGPPVGFEAGVFARLGLSAPVGAEAVAPGRAGAGAPGPRPRRRGSLLVAPWTRLAAAVVVIVALVVGGVAAGRASAPRAGAGHGPAQPIPGSQEVALRAGTRDMGDVFIYAGNPTWLLMYVHAPGWSGTLRCQVVLDQGKTLTLGRFWLAGGQGVWAASTDQPAGRISSAQVVGESGQVLAQAHLT